MIEIIFETIVNAVEMFIAIWFLTNYLGSKFKGIKIIASFFLGWLSAFLVLSIINSITMFESVGTYIYIIVYFTYALVCLKGNTLLKLWMSVIAQIIITMLAVTTIVAIACLMKCDPSAIITEFGFPRIFAIFLSKVILLLLYGIILRHKHKDISENSMWYKLIFIPFFSVISITSIMKVTLNHPETKYLILLGMLSIGAANIMVYYFYTVISNEYHNRLKIKLLEQQNDNIKSHIEATNTFVNEMRSVRHDMSNHFLSINGFLEDGNVKEAQSYISNLTNVYLPNLPKYISTNNSAFDAIINSKMTLCKEKDIYVELFINCEEFAKLSQVDTGILFGNLLDNAIEASENTEARRISIAVDIKMEYISIMISNSIESSVLKNNTDLQTSKHDKELHGIGLQNVRYVVEKYGGMIQFFEDGSEFCCHILIDKNNL